MTLGGFKPGPPKRRSMTILFGHDHDSYPGLVIVNREKGIIVDPMEPLDSEELVACVNDLMQTTPSVSRSSLQRFGVHPVLSLTGKQAT
jgi:hypothetical protein